jgi:TorA maturation chaperone TorD
MGEHVLPWAPAYCARVAAAATVGLYRTAAHLVATLLAEEVRQPS